MERIAFAFIVVAVLLVGCSDTVPKQITGSFCGDGSLDPGELCDPAIPAGSVGACPDSCTADACSSQTLVGDPSSCDAECVVEMAGCADADGCCPSGCDASTDSDCPAENVCAGRECGTVMAGEVQVDCGTCGSDESCVDFQCVAGEVTTIGQACTQNVDCGDGEECFTAGDTAFPGGYCTKSCSAGDDCPAGSVCTDSNQCFLECVSDADCTRPGYVCGANDDLTVAVCVPGGTGSTPLGGACNETSDCAGGAGATCLRSFPDGYCSRFCTGGDCPAGSACDAGGYCLETCTTSADCRDGYRCDEDNGAMLCLPSAVGTGDVGDPCNGSPDCSGGDFGFCAGGASFPDNYCSIRCGEGQAMCPTGSFCVAIADGSICFDSCDTNADCRAGYECSFDFGDPAVGGCIGIGS